MKLSLAYCAFAAAALLPVAQAQPLRMVSEFRRIGPNNQIIRADSIGDPREIISPAVLKGMHVSYRIVVATPPGMHYWMYVGANPEELIDYSIYREHTVAGVPTSLEEVKTPISGTVAAPRAADTYWLDLYIPRTTPARRIRFEAQLNFDNRWVIYPLEVRVMEGELAEALPADAALAAPRTFTNTADASRLAFQRVLCPESSTGKPTPAPTTAGRAAALTLPSQTGFLTRNAQQDLALVRTAEARRDHESVVKGLTDALGAAPLATFCAPNRKSYDAEIVLRARDFLIRSSTPPPD